MNRGVLPPTVTHYHALSRCEPGIATVGDPLLARGYAPTVTHCHDEGENYRGRARGAGWSLPPGMHQGGRAERGAQCQLSRQCVTVRGSRQGPRVGTATLGPNGITPYERNRAATR